MTMGAVVRESPGDLTLGVAAHDLGPLMERLVQAGDALACTTLEERIAIVDRVAARWLGDDSPWRRLALERVPAVTGYPQATVRLALDQLWGELRAPSLRAVAEAERIDQKDGIERVKLAVHVLAGNVPGVGVFGMVAGLLAGVPGLVKTARREPFIPALVARSIADEDPRLGSALAVVHWPGGSEAHERTAFADADLVLAYGRPASLEAIAAHGPRRLLRFGPRISVALVTSEALDDRATAADAALQVALFDQQGCLSPQIVIAVEDEPGRSEGFATALAAELGRLAVTLPAAPLALPESAAVARFLDRQRWRAQEGAPVRILADDEGRFSVVVDRSGTLPMSPLNRHLVVVPVASPPAARAMLLPLRGLIETIGYAGSGRADDVAALAETSGAHRICPLARMQAPPFAWRQSGHARLACFAADERGA